MALLGLTDQYWNSDGWMDAAALTNDTEKVCKANESAEDLLWTHFL